VLAVLLYVDDLIIASDTTSLIADFKAAISGNFNMKDLGDLEFFVGVRVSRDRATKTIYLDQTAYLERVLARYNMAECNALALPATAMTSLTAAMSPSTAADIAAMAGVRYRSAVGSLLYAAVCTRPDISNAVRNCAKFMQNPGVGHVAAVKRILRYLKGTTGYKLTFSFGGNGGGSSIGGDGAAALIGYCDADWAGDTDTRRSCTGYLFMVGGAAVSWSSRLQPTVAQSSCEAEYMALTAASNDQSFLLQLFADLHQPRALPAVIFEDNTGAIHLAQRPQLHRRTKHIDVRYHVIRDRIADGILQLNYIATAEQLADALTKNVDLAAFRRLVEIIFTE
jgi:hypothetical protein